MSLGWSLALAALTFSILQGPGSLGWMDWSDVAGSLMFGLVAFVFGTLGRRTVPGKIGLGLALLSGIVLAVGSLFPVLLSVH